MAAKVACTCRRVVLLTASDIRNSERYDAVFDELAADEEKQVIYAKASRFKPRQRQCYSSAAALKI